MVKPSEYREVDVQALRAELSRHPEFFDRDDLVDVVVELVANDFPPAITPDQIRAACDAILARLGLEEATP